MKHEDEIGALVERFESCAVEAGTFQHRQHMQVAWWYLRNFPRVEAISRFMEGINRLVNKHGAHDKYSETITWAYLLLIGERLARGPEDQSFDAFAAANPDLFDHRTGALHRYYRAETLNSDLARRVFVFPDRC